MIIYPVFSNQQLLEELKQKILVKSNTHSYLMAKLKPKTND